MSNLQPDNILIVKLGAVGDCIHTLYALRALREKYPDAKIGWAAEQKSFAVIDQHPDLDFAFQILRKEGVPNWFKSIKLIASQKWDVAIDLSNLFKSGWVTCRSGAPVRIGFDRMREGNFLFTNRRIHSRSGHMIQRYFRLLEPIGVSEVPKQVKIFVPYESKDKVDDFFSENFKAGDKVVALNPHGTWQSKLYPIEQYAKVAQDLMEDGVKVLLLWGGKNELGVVKKLNGMLDEQATIALPTDLKELYHLLSRCDIYLGNDSGPMHMAAAAGIGVVALFGPSSPDRVGPWTDKARVITLDGVCDERPCEKKKCDDPKCITGISPKLVFESTMDLIEELQ